MSLLQNKSFLACNCISYRSGCPALNGVQMKSDFGMRLDNNLNRYVGEASMYQGDSKPRGYRPSYGAWGPNKITGGMAIFNGIKGTSSLINTQWAYGMNMTSPMSGSGSLHGTGSMIKSAIAALQGIGGLSGDVHGKLEAAAALAGSGNLIGSLGALANIMSDLIGDGYITNANFRAVGSMGADITPYTSVSPDNLAAAVWNSLAASFDKPLTMGQKLNAAGSAGDPWGTSLPGVYVGDQAGYILGASLATNIKSGVWEEPLASHNTADTFGQRVGRKLLTTSKFLALK